MKKHVFMCILAICAGAFLFAQKQTTADWSKVDTTAIEVTTEKDGNMTMTIEYIPTTAEARFTYSCPSDDFEQDAAMFAIKKRAGTFSREKGYYSYSYTRPDETSYDYTNEMTLYKCYLQLTK